MRMGFLHRSILALRMADWPAAPRTRMTTCCEPCVSGLTLHYGRWYSQRRHGPHMRSESYCRCDWSHFPQRAMLRLRDEGDDMEEHIPPSSPIDLDALDDYLMSNHAPDNSMGLSGLDGFLTGIIIGPELILPSEWLPVIWGGEEPEFETGDEMRIVLTSIMGRFNEIAACFNSDPDDFEPIFLEGPDGEIITSDWAGGFLDAVALRPKAWEPLINDRKAWVMMMPFLWLNGDAELDVGSDSTVDEDRFLAEVPEIIPPCVAGIHAFWKEYQDRQKSPSRRRRSSTGRHRRGR